MYGSASGLNGAGGQLWIQSTEGVLDEPENGEGFGAQLAVGDFDGDSFSDLAITVDGETIGESPDSGAFAVLYGTSEGLTAIGNQLVGPSDPNAYSGGHFGRTIAAGDFDADGDTDVAVSALYRIGAPDVAGAVLTFGGSEGGVDPATETLFEQGANGLNGASEVGDNFGWALAAGDFDNDGTFDLAIGTPFEDNAVQNPGLVHVLYGTAAGLLGGGGLSGERDQQFIQGAGGIAGAAEKEDRLGVAVASGDYNGDGRWDLAAGARDEDVGSIVDAGSVNVIFGSASGLTAPANRLITQNSKDVSGGAETKDWFGYAVL